jgi:hypothetical protein
MESKGPSRILPLRRRMIFLSQVFPYWLSLQNYQTDRNAKRSSSTRPQKSFIFSARVIQLVRAKQRSGLYWISTQNEYCRTGFVSCPQYFLHRAVQEQSEEAHGTTSLGHLFLRTHNVVFNWPGSKLPGISWSSPRCLVGPLIGNDLPVSDTRIGRRWRKWNSVIIQGNYHGNEKKRLDNNRWWCSSPHVSTIYTQPISRRSRPIWSVSGTLLGPVAEDWVPLLVSPSEDFEE